MLHIDIPGAKPLVLNHLVLDYNGTLAVDGRLLPGVAERLMQLAEKLTLHVITADTFGTVARELDGLPCQVAVIPQEDQDQAKQDYVANLGPTSVVAVGNGRNDRLMLASAVLGMAAVQHEGAAVAAVLSADLMVSDIRAALDLLLNPKRLVATLRN